MRDVVAQLDQTFRPLFQDAREQLAAEFPHYSFEIWSSSTGGRTSYKGHDIGIECIFPEPQDNEANCVAASVGVRHITTDPEICDLGVSWCAGDHAGDSVDLLDRPLPFTGATLHAVAQHFPHLISTFREAIAAWATRSNAD